MGFLKPARGRRCRKTLAAFALASFLARPAIGASLPYAGVVDDMSVVSSCGLNFDPVQKTYTPNVTLQPSATGSPVTIVFTFYDTAGNKVGLQSVTVPAATPGKPPAPLAPFEYAGSFAVVHCGPSPVPAASGGGGGGGGAALI